MSPLSCSAFWAQCLSFFFAQPSAGLPAPLLASVLPSLRFFAHQEDLEKKSASRGNEGRRFLRFRRILLIPPILRVIYCRLLSHASSFLRSFVHHQLSSSFLLLLRCTGRLSFCWLFFFSSVRSGFPRFRLKSLTRSRVYQPKPCATFFCCSRAFLFHSSLSGKGIHALCFYTASATNRATPTRERRQW